MKHLTIAALAALTIGAQAQSLILTRTQTLHIANGLDAKFATLTDGKDVFVAAFPVNFNAGKQATAKAITDTPAFSWAGAAVYDLHTHKWAAIVVNNTFPLHTPSGKSTGFSFALFGGAAANSQANALAGAGLMASKIIFQEVSGWLMIGGAAQGGSAGTFHGVLGGGLAVRF